MRLIYLLGRQGDCEYGIDHLGWIWYRLNKNDDWATVAY